MLNDWYKKCFRRILVDMHIPDWDERFLAKLEPEKYVNIICSGNPASTMLFCISHVGLAYYPSKIGPVHSAMKNKDFIGKTVGLFHQKNIAVVAYYSVIFNNVQFLEHPEWRIKPFEGENVFKKNRYGVCCPNSPYQDFAIAQTEEFCELYPFDGIFFDMLFWPHICCCDYCQERFQKETGQSIPKVINWNNSQWVSFQRARERWMYEFAGELTESVRRTRSSMTVTHQMSPVLAPWRLAMPFSLTDHCDYTSGDFYGPPVQQSVVCKIFEAISDKKPFEFHTSCCIHLRDHVTMKNVFHMESQAFLAPAHGSAFMFIDAVNPEGTLNSENYKRISGIFSKLVPFEPYLGGNLAADVAIYVSSESRFNFKENGINLAEDQSAGDNMTLQSTPHMDAVMGMAKALQEIHIPFAVVTKNNIDTLDSYKVLILPDVLVMSDKEVEAIRRFVSKGGHLYASGYSSLVDETGCYRPDFGLADVFGVSYKGAGSRGIFFITPQEENFLQVISPQKCLIHEDGYMAVKTTSARTLATIALPYYPEKEGTVLKPSFSSIHSNPPGPATDEPAITFREYKNSRVCYAAGAIESNSQPVNRVVSAYLIRKLLGGPASIEAEAPRFVEITVFDRKKQRRLNISLVAFLEEKECIPCSAKVTVSLGHGRRFVALRSLPELKEISCREKEPGIIEFDVNNLNIFAMFELEYTII